MPKFYELQGPKSDAAKVLEHVKRCWHQELVDVHASVSVVFVYNSNGVAIAHHGSPAMATVHINNAALRAEGLADACIHVDGEGWKEWPQARRESILDHELTHLVPKRDREGNYVYDDLYRPKLLMRKHDFEIGGFNQIVERHGREAVEFQNVDSIMHYWRQQEFEFMLPESWGDPREEHPNGVPSSLAGVASE